MTLWRAYGPHELRIIKGQRVEVIKGGKAK